MLSGGGETTHKTRNYLDVIFARINLA